MLFGKWAHFHRIVDDESGLYIMMLTCFTEDLINEFAFTYTGRNRDVELFAGSAQFIFTHVGNIDVCMFFNSVVKTDTTERRFEVDHFITYLYLCSTM